MFDSILAANLNINADYEKISQEILQCRKHWEYSPIWKKWIDAANEGKIFKVESDENYESVSRQYFSNHVLKHDRRKFNGVYTLYLRSPGPEYLFSKRGFGITKYINHNEWIWKKSLENSIPYTIETISKLPFHHIGLVRVFITENTFFPTHHDYEAEKDNRPEDNIDLGKSLGISIVPLTGDVPLKIWSSCDNIVKEVPGHAHIFRDTQPHGVPFTDKIRITIRIFGDVNYDELEKLVDKDSIIY